MLQQEVMIQKVRELCEDDECVMAALMYGSFALGQGDRFSDIEFYLFFEDEALRGLEEEAWVSQIAPLSLYYVNEFGNGTAIFENLVRGEFHFEAASNMRLVEAWETAWFPSLGFAVLVDKSGELSRRVHKLAGPTSWTSVWVGLVLAFLGWALFGMATIRADIFPRMAAIVLLVGAVLSFTVFQGLPGTLVLDVAIAWMGLALLSGRAAPAGRPARAR